jgi:hypothetical protein
MINRLIHTPPPSDSVPLHPSGQELENDARLRAELYTYHGRLREHLDRYVRLRAAEIEAQTYAPSAPGPRIDQAGQNGEMA